MPSKVIGRGVPVRSPPAVGIPHRVGGPRPRPRLRPRKGPEIGSGRAAGYYRYRRLTSFLISIATRPPGSQFARGDWGRGRSIAVRPVPSDGP